MYLNTTKKIVGQLINGMPRIGSFWCPTKLIGVKDTHRLAGTPEYKLNSGFCAPNTHTFSCTTDVLKGVC